MNVKVIKPPPPRRVRDLPAGSKFIKSVDDDNPGVYIVSYNKDSYFSLGTGEQYSMNTFGGTPAYPVTVTDVRVVLD